MTWQHAAQSSTQPGIAFEIVSEAYLRGAMGCSFIDRPNEARQVTFPDGTILSLFMTSTGLGLGRFVEPDASTPMRELNSTTATISPAKAPANQLLITWDEGCTAMFGSGIDGTNLLERDSLYAHVCHVSTLLPLSGVNMMQKKFSVDQWVRLLHAASGHANINRLLATFKSGALLATPLTESLRAAFVRFSNLGCDICAASRMKRDSLGPTFLAARTLDKGERAYFDAAGPMPVPSAQFHYKYAVMLVLEKRGKKLLGGCKGHTTEEMKDHLQLMQALLRPYIGTLYVIRFDNAQETRSDAMVTYLASNGTAVEFSSPYIHEEVGLVERCWQTIERSAVASMRHANCTLSHWFNAMRNATHIEDKMVCKRVRCDDLLISNEQRLTQRIPDYSLMHPFYCPVRFFLDPEVRGHKWNEKARAGWFVGPSPENGSKPYVFDGYIHHTVGGGMQLFPSFVFDTNAKGNARIADGNWVPTPPVPVPPSTVPPPRDAIPVGNIPGVAPASQPLSLTRPRRLQPQQVLHPTASLLSALVSEDATALALAFSNGTLAAYADYDHSACGSADFLSDSVLAACILSDTPYSDLRAMCSATSIDGNLSDHLPLLTVVATTGGEMKVVVTGAGQSVSVPRHYGDFLVSRDKAIWQSRMADEIHKLLAIPVCELIHKSQIPQDATGPFRSLWAFSFNEANAIKGPMASYRARVCIGRPLKDGVVADSDPISKFATSADMLTRKLLLAVTAADNWHDFSFDISQFHQSTLIPSTVRPIIATQPTGFEERGPNGEPSNEMFWLLRTVMQGTVIAGNLANKQLDKLLIEEGGFTRALSDSRLFTLQHAVHGGIRLLFHADDGVGAAETPGGVDYVRSTIERTYKISQMGPWKTMCGFNVTRDRIRRSITMTASALIKSGIDDLLPSDLVYSTALPASESLYKLLCTPVLTPADMGYGAWLDEVTWFRRAVGWALHVAQMHPAGAGALSMLCGLAKSPGPDGVKALKHFLCWLNTNSEEGITWGGQGNQSLEQGPLKEIGLAANAKDPIMPYSLLFYSDSDLRVLSRYCVIALFNRGCIFAQSRLQHSAAPDITSSEAYAFSVAAIMCDVVRGRIADLGYASAIKDPTPIMTDNDAVRRIASNAGSAKRSLMVLRRLAFVHYLTEQGELSAIHVNGSLNLSNFGTKYVTKHEIAWASRILRNKLGMLP
jgi:hypothetical protein